MQHHEVISAGLGEGVEFSEDPIFARSKTSLRMHYEAQVSVLNRQLGDLEKIRTDLGLSSRKISQLLMIDPSSWTRWTKQGDAAPPHIWRALQWYLILREKIPGLTPQYFVGKDPSVLHQQALQKISEEKAAREGLEKAFGQKLHFFEKKMRFYKLLLGVFMGSSVALALVLVFWMILKS